MTSRTHPHRDLEGGHILVSLLRGISKDTGPHVELGRDFLGAPEVGAIPVRPPLAQAVPEDPEDTVAMVCGRIGGGVLAPVPLEPDYTFRISVHKPAHYPTKLAPTMPNRALRCPWQICNAWSHPIE